MSFNENLLGKRLDWLREVCANSNDPNHRGIRGQNPPGNERTRDNIKELFVFINHLKLLERFVDPRNPETSQKPLPDGTNLEDGVLRASWILHRAWIRALHYRTLYAGEEGYGWEQLQQILKITYAFLEAENIAIPKLRQHRQEFDIMYTLFNAIGKALIAFTTKLFQEIRPQPTDGNYEEQETILYNIQHGRFQNLWLKVI